MLPKKGGKNLSWIGAVCTRPPPGGDPIVYTIERKTNRVSFRRFLDKLSRDILKHEENQRVVLVYDGK